MNAFKRMTTPLLAGLFVTGAVAAAQPELPAVTEEGLHLVPDSKLAIVYADPEAELAPYDKVMLLDTYVAFKKNWARDQRRSSTNRMHPNERDMEQIKQTLAEEFRTVFTEVLEQGGYPVVAQAGEDVLLIRPAIINLDATAPDLPQAGMNRSYVASAGEMTLYVEVYDSITGDLMAKALDRKSDTQNAGFYTWATSVSNKVAAERILKGWANILLDALNEAKQEGSG
jgi:hypothetical protein